MFCDICIQAQVTNVFTNGCDMFKKEAVTKHEKKKGIHILCQWNANSLVFFLVKLFLNTTNIGNNSHVRAVQSSTSSAGMVKATISKSKAAIISALRNVYFAAINNLANASSQNLCIDQVYS